MHLVTALNSRLREEDKISPSALSKKALFSKVAAILQSKNIPFLLIFDNVEDYKQVQSFIHLTDPHRRQHILLTSRSINVWGDRIEVGKFQRSDSLELIQKALSKDKNDDMEELARSLSDYPLGLALAVSFIKSAPTTTIRKYLTLHMKRTLEDTKHQQTKILDDYTHGAKAALEISLKSIADHSEEALDALYFMSLLNSKDIPESYIESYMRLTQNSLTADEAIKYIYDQSLLEVREVTDEDIHSDAKVENVHNLSLHDLTHQLIQELIPLEEKKRLIDIAVQVLNEVYSGPTEVFTKKVLSQRNHILHAQKLCESANKIGYTSPQLLQLKVCLFECLMGGVRDFKAAAILMEEIEKGLHEGHKVEPYYMALYYMNKAFYETSMPRFDLSIKYMEKGLSILNALKGYEEEKLRAITNLAQYNCFLGHMDKANTYIDAGKEIFGNLNSELFNSLFIYVWAFVLNTEGNYEEALQVADRAKAYPNLGTNYPTIEFYILYQKALALLKLNRLDQASQVIDDCESKAKQFFQSTDDIFFAHIGLLKGLILVERNKDIGHALETLNNALNRFNAEYHGDGKHIGHGKIHLALGKAYVLEENYDKALEEYNLSETVYKTLLKEQKVDDVSDLYKDLAILGADMKDERLAHKYLNLHISNFGIDHPRTEQILKHLDQLGLPVPN